MTFSTRLRWFLLLASLSPCVARAEAELLKEDRAPNSPDRVEVLLEVGGEVTDMEDSKPRNLKMSVVGSLRYDEKLVAGASVRQVLRDYERAEATIKIEDGGLKPTLREERRMIQASLENDRLVLFSPKGSLTREELDLLDTPADTLLISSLLPDRAVDVGDQWPVPETILPAFLSIDVSNSSDVICELMAIDAKVAKIEFKGTVAGGVGGIATDLDVKGRYKFDRALRRITWLAMVVKEKRAAGHVTAGLNVAARVQMTIAPGVKDSRLDPISVRDQETSPSPEALDLAYQSRYGKWRFHHGRDWHVMHEATDGAALRLVGRGELIAQCNVSSLADAARGQSPTLEQFQNDIKTALGEPFQQFKRATTSKRESASSTDVLTIHHVAAFGVASEVPVQWDYYLICDEASGRQAVLAFTCEQDLVERLAEADRKIVNSFEFVPLSNDPESASAAATVRSIGEAKPAPAPSQSAAPFRMQLR